MAAESLDLIEPRQLGQNLKAAREERGLTQAEAAAVIDVARTTLTAIEQGQRQIKADELITLARAYGRQIADFTRPRPTAREFRVQYRGPARQVAPDQERIAQSQRAFQELCRDYLELEQIVEAPLTRNYPHPYNITGLKVSQAAESVATQERNRLGLGDGPLPILRAILEQEVGIRVFYFPFADSRFSEMYYHDDELGACLAVNQNHPEERRRWSLAHGYGHFLVHRYQPSLYLDGVYQREQFADSFAIHFLMPATGLLRQYNQILQSRSRPTVGDLCLLAHYYSVSLTALVYRLEEMGVAPRGTWENLRDRGLKVRQAQEQLGLAPIPQQGEMLPLRYQYLAVEAFQQGQISEGLLARFLRVQRLEARYLVQILSEDATDELAGNAVGLEPVQAVTV